MPKRKVKYTKRNPQPTPPAEKPKKKVKPKKAVKKDTQSGVSTAVVKLAESKHGRFVPYYILAFVILFIGVFVYLAFLAPKPEANTDTSSSPSSSSTESNPNDGEYDAELQFAEPAEAEEIAVMKTSMGDIAMRFFENEAPKAVENFKTLAKDGYYSGITFHRVMNDFMIQTGDPTATGAGGESAFGSDFEDEFSPSLLNVRGAVAMANAGPNTNGSQFFINQKKTVDDSMLSGDIFPEGAKQAYKEHGGNALLDGYYTLGENDQSGHTVFAQVLSGMDVVDSIAAVETVSDKPVKDVTIISISFMTYGEYLSSQDGAGDASSDAADASSKDAE